jgi:hypothetical protein
MVWEAYGGHMKASGSIIVIGLFLLPFDKSILLRFMLALQAIAGLDLMAETRMMRPGLISPHVAGDMGYEPNPPGTADNAVLSDLRSSIEWVDPQPVMKLYYQGLWKPVQRELRPITVAVTNHSDVAWQPGLGKHPIWLGYMLYSADGHRFITERSVPLDKPLGPGETKEFTIPLELWRANQNYVVEFSLRQDGPGWFAHADPSFGRKYQFRVE